MASLTPEITSETQAFFAYGRELSLEEWQAFGLTRVELLKAHGNTIVLAWPGGTPIVIQNAESPEDALKAAEICLADARAAGGVPEHGLVASMSWCPCCLQWTVIVRMGVEILYISDITGYEKPAEDKLYEEWLNFVTKREGRQAIIRPNRNNRYHKQYAGPRTSTRNLLEEEDFSVTNKKDRR